LAKGHIHSLEQTSGDFGLQPNVFQCARTLGVAQGYGETRPSAKRQVPDLPETDKTET
jgi:hypothetical protein